jgi:hypothetical protein
MPTSTARSARSSFAVDQKLGEGATLRVASELADPIGPLGVGEQKMEEFGGDPPSARFGEHSCSS